MSTQIHSNKTGTVTVQLDGLAKDASFTVDDPSICGVSLTSATTGDHFTGLLQPTGPTHLGQTTVRFVCQKLDDSAFLDAHTEFEVVEGQASQVNSIAVVEN